ncbi:MAG TPA: hypothetical protein VL443_15830 [Cyclobacteriaceae bacterium]|jgi:hypothetical protein|nr:hypothetical protein [Cyclobacteriaceae bacterium]
MITNTEIISNKIVTSVEQLAGFLKPGDIFLKAHSNTRYKFDESKFKERVVICENLETQEPEQIYYNSPVYKLT